MQQQQRQQHATVVPPSKQTLMTDAGHKPKTHGSFGILVVGLGGANGTTMLAGILANRLGIEWHGSKGEPLTPNYYGCITQIPPRGVHGGVGFKDRMIGHTPLRLADATLAAVGGWDIRPTPPGDALLEQQILDYDLVRQVKDEMNASCKIFRGLFDPRFIGRSQHGTATHVLTEQDAQTDADALKCLRADIRYFKWRNGVVGHTTVIWSASVEPNSDLVKDLKTASDLLESIELTEEERGGPLPPSLLYATAALLEGCSFVNGGSQNTLSCPGLWELAKEQLGVYCLGTDFKAGQTKFKTAAVEYLRTMGLTPRVIASSNHLGNNDMRNIATAKAVSSAKLRVKHDIFAPWQEEDLDHKVSIMFTEYINDDKRDFVEYTSLGFLGQTHTMVTYTRASDSVLCVPLMIDAAVWCDFFSAWSWPCEKVSKALAYLFKVPEGGAKGVDPGFFRQMEELTAQVVAAHESRTVQGGGAASVGSFNTAKRRVKIRDEDEQADAEWTIPLNARVICAGLACVDMQLNEATGGDGGEGIETFQGETSIGGGSVAMACKTLGRLCHGEPLDDGYMQVTPPVVSSVTPLCMIGGDDTGTKLLSLLEKCGSACRNIDTHVVRHARAKYPSRRTALSVLPIFQDGRRGCFFDAASNNQFSSDQLLEMVSELSSGLNAAGVDTSGMATPVYGALLFGYPHLLPLMHGQALGRLFHESRKVMIDQGIVAMDLNGVSESPIVKAGALRSLSDLRNDRVIGPALEHVDIMHMNEDELILLTGCRVEDEFAFSKAVELFLQCGVAVVAVTRGLNGSYVACNSADRFAKSPALPKVWANCSVHMPAAELPTGQGVNTNGAGDSYTAGLLIASMLRHTGKAAAAPPEPAAAASPFKHTTDPPGSPARSTAGSSTGGGSGSSGSKKMTPYTLYMRENYVTLKQQCQDDKKAIFTKCHEMWENEAENVKAMYARMVQEEYNETAGVETSTAILSDTSMEALDTAAAATAFLGDVAFQTDTNADASLSLESAVQFAGLIAAYHVDTGTRNLDHVDLQSLLQRSIMPLSLVARTHEI